MAFRFSLPLLYFSAVGIAASQQPDLAQILARIERLEQENASLKEELRQLKSRLDGTGPPIEERVAVQERRVEEQQQTKVESSERVPVKLTGMVLFNAYSGGRNGVPQDFPTFASTRNGLRQIRGTMAQTSVGLQVDSPTTIAGARARGEVIADFYGEYDEYAVPRLRTGFLDLNWNTRGVRVGIEKPIVAPRNPTSLAQVVYPALWGAGNLWFWQPQARIEQRFDAGATRVNAQLGLFQTKETSPGGNLAPRPSWQTRLQMAHNFDEERRVEFAPGFAYSRTQAAGSSAPSQLVTADWLIAPSRWWEFTGALFHGKNAGPLGGLRQGVLLVDEGVIRAVGTTGGWGQIMLRPASRLRIHAMLGAQDDRNRDLITGAIARNLSWALNGITQLSPNVLLGLELQQIRTTFLGPNGTRVLNRYDVSLAYLF
jgi:uncharacterized protein (UPF0335 family)